MKTEFPKAFTDKGSLPLIVHASSLYLECSFLISLHGYVLLIQCISAPIKKISPKLGVVTDVYNLSLFRV
jgi:hypothetical protein